MVLTPSRRRMRRRSALGALLVGLGSLLAASGLGPLGSAASALQNANSGTGFVMQSIPENQSAAYPDTAIIPDGCDARSQVIRNQSFAIDPDGSGPQPAGQGRSDMAALGDIPPAPATLVMTWSGWNPACAADVSLSVKKADGPSFDPLVRQELISFVGCDGAAPNQGQGCASGGTFRLELAMPTLESACHYQVDAVVGPPLEIVGPGGSFYTNTHRTAGMNRNGENTLISANNGRANCVPATTTTTTSTTVATTTSTTTCCGGGGSSSTTTSTTAPSTTTTTVGSTTTSSVLGTTVTQQPTTSTTGATVLGVTVTRPGGTTLPRTGSDSGAPGALALGLVVAGIGVVLLGADRRLDLLRRRP